MLKSKKTNIIIVLLVFTLIALVGQVIYKYFNTKADPVAPVFNNEENYPEDNVRSAVEKLEQSIVNITGGGNSRTGLIINNEGYILTTTQIDKKIHEVFLKDGSKVDYTPVRIKQPSDYDLNIIKIDPKYVKSAMTMGYSDNAKIGKSIYTMSNIDGLPTSVTYGIISFKDIDVPLNSNKLLKNIMLTDALVDTSSGGGAIFDNNGKVLGIILGTLTKNDSYTGLGVIIPIDKVKAFLKSNSLKYIE